MSFWDDIKVLGSEVVSKGSIIAKDAAKKAQNAADMTKIKIEIAAREKEIKDIYMKIGKAYYEANKEEAGDFAEDIAEITAKFIAISELKEEYSMYKEEK